jgi:hypothetical protein
MRLSLWRKTSIAILSAALLNMGFAGAAQAAIVDTSVLVSTTREADLNTVRAQLDRAEVRAQFEAMGVDATAVDRRIASLNDRELHRLSLDMQSAPAGGDAVWIVGAVFIVLIILELTGVIDIFKKT